jgi:hypothetical protein
MKPSTKLITDCSPPTIHNTKCMLFACMEICFLFMVQGQNGSIASG